MCISILSTAHPDYPFILISNRDEVISRPTLRADWWDPPNEHILGGRDLLRAERGTWLGITRQGRFAVLTNFRDPGVEVARDKSRGGIVNSFLQVPPDVQESDEEFAHRLIATGIHDVGGFTLLFGQLRKAAAVKADAAVEATQPCFPGLARVSNRTTTAESLPRIATRTGETHALSNSHFGDMAWPKVVHGEQLLRQAIHGHVARGTGDPAPLIHRCFEILAIDTMPTRQPGQAWADYANRMRRSIFIPAEKGVAEPSATTSTLSPEAYGTGTQTVILVDTVGRVTFVERTLYDATGRRLPAEESERRFEFQIEGWDAEEEGELSECPASSLSASQLAAETASGSGEAVLVSAASDQVDASGKAVRARL